MGTGMWTGNKAPGSPVSHSYVGSNWSDHGCKGFGLSGGSRGCRTGKNLYEKSVHDEKSSVHDVFMTE